MMKVIRTRSKNNSSVWTVEFDQNTLDKVAKMTGNPEHRTYNTEESFIVTMNLANKKTGAVTHVNKDIDDFEIGYEISFLNETDDTIKVRFDFADGRRFETVMKKTRGYMTGAFYKFFNYLVTKTPVFLHNVDVVNTDETKAEEAVEELKELAEEGDVQSAE